MRCGSDPARCQASRQPSTAKSGGGGRQSTPSDPVASPAGGPQPPRLLVESPWGVPCQRFRCSPRDRHGLPVWHHVWLRAERLTHEARAAWRPPPARHRRAGGRRGAALCQSAGAVPTCALVPGRTSPALALCDAWRFIRGLPERQPPETM